MCHEKPNGSAVGLRSMNINVSVVDQIVNPNATFSPVQPPKYPALVLMVIPALTIFGNILVVLSVLRERTLQTVTNYFIVSLAVADFLVALCVMPFAVYVEVRFIYFLPLYTI